MNEEQRKEFFRLMREGAIQKPLPSHVVDTINKTCDELKDRKIWNRPMSFSHVETTTPYTYTPPKPSIDIEATVEHEENDLQNPGR